MTIYLDVSEEYLNKSLNKLEERMIGLNLINYIREVDSSLLNLPIQEGTLLSDIPVDDKDFLKYVLKTINESEISKYKSLEEHCLWYFQWRKNLLNFQEVD